MPNVRCRHYDDSGNALHGGCLKRGRGCYYIHPSESGWANAAPAGTQGVGKASSTSGMRPRTGFGTGANMTAVGSSSTSGWGAQPPGTPTSSAWDTSEWGLGGSGAANKGGGGWGNADNAAPAKSSTVSSGDGGWGASSATKGSVVSEPWGAASSSTWGKGGDGGGAGTGGGWGNASGGASPVRKNSTTAPPPTDTWGTSGASSSTTARPNLPARPRGDRTTARGRASSGTWGADGDANMPVGWGSSGVPDLRKKDDAQPRGDTSAGSRSDMDMADWTEVSQTNSRVLRSGATSPTGTEHTTSTSFAKAGRPPTTTPKDGPIALPQKAIALVAKGARLDAEIREAEAERDRIKRIQLSSSYSRVGKAGRDRMDRDRLKADEKVNERKAEQTGLIKHLATYMDPTAPTPVDPETYAKQVEEAMRYLDEAKEHIQDLRKSHLVPLQIERSAAGVTEQSTEEGEQGPSVMEEIDDDGPRAILAARIRELTERMEHLRTDFSVTGYINLRDVIEEKIQQRFNAISAPKEEGELTRPNTPPSLPPPPPPHAELSQRVEKIGEEVSELANKTATVLTAAHQREEEFQGLKSFWEVMKQAQELAMNQQLQNETLLRQRGEEIEKLKQQVLPLMEVLSAPPPPTADLEALRASVVARIAASINQEIAPILAETRESCREQLARHKQEVYDDILKKLASPVNAQKMFRVLLAMDVDAS